MKTVKEIKDFKDKVRHMPFGTYNQSDLNGWIFDTLIGIAEHLEKKALTPAFEGVPIGDDERRGAIKGLKAAAEAASFTSDMHFLRQRLAITITRLENGGDL